MATNEHDESAPEVITEPEGVKNAVRQVTDQSIDAVHRAESLLAELRKRQVIPTLLHPKK